MSGNVYDEKVAEDMEKRVTDSVVQCSFMSWG
jgi:hypothetical protein